MEYPRIIELIEGEINRHTALSKAVCAEWIACINLEIAESLTIALNSVKETARRNEMIEKLRGVS